MSAHILKSHIHSASKDRGRPGKYAWKKQTNSSTLFWVKADIRVVILFLKVQRLVALQTVPPAVLTRIHCVTELLDSRFMYEFGGAFPRSPVQVQKAVFPCVLAENAKKKIVLQMFTQTVFWIVLKLSAPSVHSGARCVSGPALVRTAPALPAPWNPNYHAPSSDTSLTGDPANHSASFAFTSAPSADTIRRGIIPIGWREIREPMTRCMYYASTNVDSWWSDARLGD